MHLLFAWRYFKAPKSTQAINWIARISVIAMAVGTAALILVLSVFNGFEGMVKSLYSSFYPDWRLMPAQGKVLTLTAAQLKSLQQVAGVEAVSLVVEERALLQAGENQALVTLKGVDTSYTSVSGVAQHLVSGEFAIGTATSPYLVLGAGVEAALSVLADRNLEPITVYLPKKTEGLQVDWAESIRVDTAQTAASFLIQQDFDDQYAITSLDFMREKLGLTAEEASSVELRVNPKANASDIRSQLQAIMSNQVKVEDRYEQNKTLYRVMRTERWIVYGVLSLILIVAAFTMIGALTMLVLEKQKDIQVLQALGANKKMVRRIFLTEGLLLSMLGSGIGMLLAYGLAWLQLTYHLIPLEGGSFLIDYYPVAIKAEDFFLVTGTVLVIALFASWIPAARAASHQISLREM
ncbi:MAG: FtsX-like permease family protein [Bacteroidota bacterium]|jgi:lipoprotein-releasing system permease protein